jgi:hypothetical protein
MDRSRKANREGNEITLQHTSPRDASLVEEMIDEKLARLEASVERLMQTPDGTAMLQQRVNLFGECKRIEGETPAQYHDKLRRWLERDTLTTKSPLHPPRQTGG